MNLELRQSCELRQTQNLLEQIVSLARTGWELCRRLSRGVTWMLFSPSGAFFFKLRNFYLNRYRKKNLFVVDRVEKGLLFYRLA